MDVMPRPEVRDDVRHVGPPLPYLVVAFAGAVLSAALLAVAGIAADIAGYVTGSIVTIALVGEFHRADLRRRQHPFYVARPALARCASVIVAIGFVLAALHAWSIASELAR